VVNAKEAYVGMDVVKLPNAGAIADAGREGEIRIWASSMPEGMKRLKRLIVRLAGQVRASAFRLWTRSDRIPLHRLITTLGHSCTVFACSAPSRPPRPSMIPANARRPRSVSGRSSRT
jgi:transposase